ncbi:hypothetical protein DL769_007475 [Monosporascus sp. CRB-8-3]|nr:hypothetical protein DL769_007475 [Monosporascus sp. CRB-8-3]
MSAISGCSPNVVVVGGGIVGASIAWHLAAQDANVTIVAEDIGGTATPNSFAWINAAYGNPKFYYDLRYRSMARWRALGDELLPGLPLHWGGSLSWDMSPEELEEYQKQHSSWGYDIIRVEQSEISEREPAFADDALPKWGWGLYAGEEGAVEAADAANHFIADAEARGARVLSAEVTGFVKKGNRIRGVVTASGEEVHAHHVVLAAGLGSVPLLATEGISLPVTGEAGLLIHTKPTGPLLNGVTYADELHLRQKLDGRILAGTDFAGGDPGPDPQKTAGELFVKLKQALKGTEDLELDYFTVGHRPTPQDGYPILGATGLEGLTLAVMHSGVTLAPVVGDLISKLVLTGKSDPMLADFSLGRFNTTSTARRSHAFRA